MRSKNLFFAAIWILFVLALSSSTPHLIATHFNFSLYISFSRVVNEFIKFLFQSNALLLWPTNAQNKKETYYRFRKGRKKKKKRNQTQVLRNHSALTIPSSSADGRWCPDPETWVLVPYDRLAGRDFGSWESQIAVVASSEREGMKG